MTEAKNNGYSSILVTGGAGFIGSNFVRLLATERPDARIHVIDALTYAGNLSNIEDLVKSGRITFRRGDIANSEDVRLAVPENCDAVVNFAAESHVDRSLQDASAFLRTNIQGTQVLIHQAMQSHVKRFVQVSTDEVYGSIDAPDSATETSPLLPSNPYSASKAGADLLLYSLHHTHGTDIVVTRCTNNYGPYQFPEKLIPLMITNALEERPLPVYGDGQNIRDWIHVEDHCRGILAALEQGRSGQVYNFGGRCEWTNLDLVKKLLDLLNRPHSLITFVKDRLGHDRRYSLAIEKSREELGWSPRVEFESGLERTVIWYKSQKSWWRSIKSGEYMAYYDAMYSGDHAIHSGA